MNEKQQLHFREVLLQWREELIEQANSTVTHIQYETSNYPDEADRASREEGFGLELRTRDREYKLIQKINRTLELLDLGEYGYCKECGIEIGIPRLQARPTATLCIECKTLAEIRERQEHS